MTDDTLVDVDLREALNAIGKRIFTIEIRDVNDRLRMALTNHSPYGAQRVVVSPVERDPSLNAKQQAELMLMEHDARCTWGWSRLNANTFNAEFVTFPHPGLHPKEFTDSFADN